MTDELLNTKEIVVFFAVTVFAIIVLVLARNVVPASMPITATTPILDGAALYARYCALCHGKNGEGYAAPASTALRNQDFLRTADDAYLRENIAQGRRGTRMSAWSAEHGGPLLATQLDALVQFIRGWQTESSVDVSGVAVQGQADRGAAIYAERCAACHGEAGGGTDEAPGAPQGAPSLNHPIFLKTASDGFIRYAIAQGRQGTVMPAFAGKLSDQEVDDLVAFIRSWQP